MAENAISIELHSLLIQGLVFDLASFRLIFTISVFVSGFDGFKSEIIYSFDSIAFARWAFNSACDSGLRCDGEMLILTERTVPLNAYGLS